MQLQIDVLPTNSTSSENTVQDVLTDLNTDYWKANIITENNKPDEENTVSKNTYFVYAQVSR